MLVFSSKILNYTDTSANTVPKSGVCYSDAITIITVLYAGVCRKIARKNAVFVMPTINSIVEGLYF
jgi:hypothetical protein